MIPHYDCAAKGRSSLFFGGGPGTHIYRAICVTLQTCQVLIYLKASPRQFWRGFSENKNKNLNIFLGTKNIAMFSETVTFLFRPNHTLFGRTCLSRAIFATPRPQRASSKTKTDQPVWSTNNVKWNGDSLGYEVFFLCGFIVREGY